MMQRPWDCAQPDEWLPQSLRLCWGGDGGGGGGDGGGWSGDSGGSGWGDGGYGGATTGGGDWGSSGSYDASGFQGSGDLGAWAGTAYDASTAGTGAGGGGDWGSFAATSYPDSTPGAIFTDIAGPNPGVTTGGGDWGSAGAFSAAGTGGGPGGTFSAESGVGGGGNAGGGGFWGDTGGGGGFTGYGGGGGGGYTGGGGGKGGGGGGGTFGGFGSAGTSAGGKGGGALGGSNFVSAAPSGGKGFADTVGGGSLAGPGGKTSSDAPTKGEAQIASVAPDADPDADPGADPGAEPDAAPLGSPPEASTPAPEAQAGPSLSDAAPAGNIGGQNDAAPASAGQTAAPAQTSQQSNFGPQSLSADYQGSPYSSNYDQSAAPSQAPASFDSRFGDWGQQDAAPSSQYQGALSTLSDLTQTALSGYDYEGSPYSSNYDQAPAAQQTSSDYQGPFAGPDVVGSGRLDSGQYGGRGYDLPGVQTISNWISDLMSRGPDPQALEFSLPTTPQWAQNPRAFELTDPTAAAKAESRTAATPFAVIDPKAADLAQSRIDAKDWTNINTWLAPQNQWSINAIADLFADPSTTSALDQQAVGEQGRAGQIMGLADQLGREAISPGGIDPSGEQYGVTATAPPDLSSQLGIENISATQGIDPGGEQYGTEAYAPGGIDPSTAQYATAPDLASQLGIENISAVNWPSVFEAPAQEPDYDSVFEAPAQDTWGSVFEGAPSVDPTSTTSVDVTMESGQPGQQPTTDDASTPGSDPALSGAAANAPQGQPAEGQPGQPGAAPPGAPPAASGQTYVTEASVAAVANAASNAALNVGAPIAAVDAASQAAHNAALNLASPADQANAASAAALQAGATPAQAQAIAEATYAAAMSQPAFTPGQPGQPQQAPPGPEQPGAPVGTQTPPQTQAPPPSLVEQSQQQPGTPMPTARPADAPPGLVDMQTQTPGVPMPQARPADAPQVPPGAPEHSEDNEEGEPAPTAQPGGRLGAPTSGRQNTPVVSPRVIQEQQGQWRNRPLNEDLHGIMTRAAEHAGVIVRVKSGGQIHNHTRATYRTVGGWTGSIRHDDGGAGDVQLEHNGRILSFNNPNDRPIMEAFVREAARLGATGMGAGVSYMGDKTIHVGFGNPNFWNADNAGSRALQQAWNEGRRGPANRPPADIPMRTAMPIPLPRRRPDEPQVEVVQPQPPPTPPADIPAALPSPTMPLPPAETPAPVAPVDRPLVDIPAPAPKGPNEFDIPVTPALRGQLDPVMIQRTIAAIQKEALRGINPDTTKEQAMAQGAKGRAALIAAGVPPAMARAAMLDTGAKTAVLMGYGPGGKNATVMGIPIPQSMVQGKITEGVGEAMQGYNPAASGGVIGKSNAFGGPVQGPPAPAAMMREMERQENQQNLDPRGWQQASLLDILQNFNPISTAEARSGRSQAGNLQAPRADPGTIQSRLSSQRSNVINDLQTNQGLRNTLDLIVTGEVGSQGKAAVLGFLETAMNKVAAEASREGRAATGRDLLNYLNSRSYFPDTWGKIESGKIKGGALTDDLLDAVAGGSNTTKGSTGNSSAKSAGSRFGGNPTNATIGKEHYGVENYGHHAAWYNALGALDTPTAVGSMPPMPAPAPAELRGLAKGGRVDKDEPVVVGEEGPEYFVPDRPGTVVPHMPQPGKGKNVDRWPKLPAPDYPGRYGGVEREYERQTRAAQNPLPSLMDLIDSGRLPLNEANWRAMLNDPSLIALGRSRMDDRREGIDPGAEQYGAFIPPPGPAAEPPDPGSPMAQALGYGSIKRRPMRIGRQDYSQ